MVFDEVFHLTAAAVDGFVQEGGTGAFEAGDDEPDVVAPVGDFGRDHYSQRSIPGTGLILYLS